MYLVNYVFFYTISVLGMLGIVEFNSLLLSILEAVTQHPAILMEHHAEVIDSILNPLAALIASRNGEQGPVS